MKLLTFLLILGVASCALSVEIKPSTSARIDPLSIKTTALKIARQTWSFGRTQEYDYIGELIAALKDLDWNRVLDAFEVFLRNSKTHIQTAMDEVKAIEISDEIKDGIVSNLPDFASTLAHEFTQFAIEVSGSIISLGEYFGFPEVYIAVVVALANLYIYGVAFPVYLLFDVLEWINAQQSGLGDQLWDVFDNLLLAVADEFFLFLEAIYSQA